MPTARQAPQFTLRGGRGLALIDDLRRLRDWYLALCRHRKIVAENLKKENNMFNVGDVPTDPVDPVEELFANIITHRGSTYYHDGVGPTDDITSYYVGDSTFTLKPMAPTYSRHRGSSNTGTSLYNSPPAFPQDRPPYSLPRPRGLVLKGDLIDFSTWATSPGSDTLAAAASAAPAKPKPAGLATRADLIALAEQLAAEG